MARTHRTQQLLTVLLLSAAPAGASPSAPPAPPDDAHASPALLELRAELIKAGRDKAADDVARFRPLCDKDGYPLVGNPRQQEHDVPAQPVLRRRAQGREALVTAFELTAIGGPWGRPDLPGGPATAGA